MFVPQGLGQALGPRLREESERHRLDGGFDALEQAAPLLGIPRRVDEGARDLAAAGPGRGRRLAHRLELAQRRLELVPRGRIEFESRDFDEDLLALRRREFPQQRPARLEIER